MDQVVSSAHGVKTINVPAPTPRLGQVLVEVEYSCVSPGSELAATASHQESLLTKLRSRPEKALAVWRMFRSQGVPAITERIAQQTKEARSLGYSCSGRVIDPGGAPFQIGERVACAGAGVAVHAQRVSVPQNLVCRVPGGVSARAASTVALGAIALEGVRRADIDLGAHVGVIGLGAVGQLTARLAAAAGATVWVSDLNPERVAIAIGSHPRIRELPQGSAAEYEELVSAIGGLDAVIVTAASSQPGLIDLAAKRCRIRGRIVVVGDFPVAATRELLYAKELEVRLSCSYGPGRYDSSYEDEGLDYPAPYARWTANRNMRAYLEAIEGAPAMWDSLWPQPAPVSTAPELFESLSSGAALMAILEYPRSDEESSSTKAGTSRSRAPRSGSTEAAPLRLGVIGSGEFVRLMHLPLLAEMRGVELSGLATRSTLTGERLAKQYGFASLTTDAHALLADPELDAVLVTVRHREHARLVLAALRAGKHVFVEKPLALDFVDVEEIEEAVRASDRTLTVGFNRRMAPGIAALAGADLRLPQGSVVQYRFAAGVLPPGHWVNGAEGGGRLVGEACHAIDLCEALLGDIREARIEPLGGRRANQEHASDAAMTLVAERGVAHVTYAGVAPADGNKERIEVTAAGRVSTLIDFRELHGGQKAFRAARSDKGHRALLESFVSAVRTGGAPPISYDSMFRTSRLAIHAQRAADEGHPVTWRADQ